MATKPSLSDLLELTPAERILLVEELWDSLAGNPDAVPISDAQKRELDVRLESHRANPAAGSTWSDVKNRIARNRIP